MKIAQMSKKNRRADFFSAANIRPEAEGSSNFSSFTFSSSILLGYSSHVANWRGALALQITS